MDRVQFTFVVFFNLISLSKYVFGEAVAFFPSEAKLINQFQGSRPHYQVNRYLMPAEYMPQRNSEPDENVINQEQMFPLDHVTPILHRSDVIPPSVPETPMQGLNFSLDEGRSEDYSRASKSGYTYPTHSAASYPRAPAYSYPPSSGYTPPASPIASSFVSSASSSPPADKFPILKTDLTPLFKPVTTKVANKVSGLIGLVLSLLTGTASDDLEMKGFKDIIINGIVRPLLIAKGGIKSLISKLTIPVISLLLINLEVLITVWWLWEECPESMKPTYSQPASSSYNSYK